MPVRRLPTQSRAIAVIAAKTRQRSNRAGDQAYAPASRQGESVRRSFVEKNLAFARLEVRRRAANTRRCTQSATRSVEKNEVGISEMPELSDRTVPPSKDS